MAQEDEKSRIVEVTLKIILEVPEWYWSRNLQDYKTSKEKLTRIAKEVMENSEEHGLEFLQDTTYGALHIKKTRFRAVEKPEGNGSGT